MAAAVLLRGSLTAVIASCALLASTSVAWAGRQSEVRVIAPTPAYKTIAWAHFDPDAASAGGNLFRVCDHWHGDNSRTTGEIWWPGQRPIRLEVPNTRPGIAFTCKMTDLRIRSGTRVNISVCADHGRRCSRSPLGVA